MAVSWGFVVRRAGLACALWVQGDRHAAEMTEADRETGGLSRTPGQRAPRAAITPSTSTWSTANTPVVETSGVRTAKAMGLRNLPSKTWQVNVGWVIAANIAADLVAWTRLLGCHDDELRDTDPDTLRYRNLAPPRQDRPPRPRAHPQDQPRTGHGKTPSLPAGSASAPASTRLTSADNQRSREGGASRRGRSRCAPGHTGHPAHHPTREETDIRLKGCRHNQ